MERGRPAHAGGPRHLLHRRRRARRARPARQGGRRLRRPVRRPAADRWRDQPRRYSLNTPSAAIAQPLVSAPCPAHAREIALLTNPTSGKGKGARARDAVLGRLRDAGHRGPRPGGPRRRRGARPGPPVRRRRGRRAGGRAAATAWSTSASRRSPATGTTAGHHPGRHRQRRGPLLRPARARTRSPRPTGSSPAAPAPSTWPAAARKYFVTVLAAGFDAIVNERANRMTWPKGQMRYNLATLAELRTFEPLPYTLDLDGETLPPGRDAGRGRQRAVVRRRPADHRGRDARRRPARRGDHQADEQARPDPHLPQAVQGHPHHAPAVRAPPGPPR